MIGVVLLQPLNKLIRPASFREQTTANGFVRKLVNGNAALLFRLEQAPPFRPRNFLERIGIVGGRKGFSVKAAPHQSQKGIFFCQRLAGKGSLRTSVKDILRRSIGIYKLDAL